MVAGWLLVVSGLAWAYTGFTNNDLIGAVFGGLAPVVQIALFGGAAIYMVYVMVGPKKKKK